MERKRMELQLYEAAKCGYFDCLTRKSGYPDILEQTTTVGNNILHVAAQYRQEYFITQLVAQSPLQAQTLLFQGNHKGDTPLHVAVKDDFPNISKIFIDFAKTLVSNVVGRGKFDRGKELLHMRNVDKDTALHYAARYGHSLVVKLLVDEDAELCNITNDACESPLFLATAQGHFDTALTILYASPPSFSHEGSQGMTALHAALYYKPSSNIFLKAVVERRPDLIRKRDDIGWTPLHYAACYENVEAVRLFLKHDDSAVLLLDNNGESALHIAAFLGHIDAVKLFIESSPDACELINSKGQTALHTAVIGGRLNVVKFILETSTFKHLRCEQDKDGSTALELAALHQRYNILKFLAQDETVKVGLSKMEHTIDLGCFDGQSEVTSEALDAHLVLKMKFGVQHMQGQAIIRMKKSPENQSVQSQSATPTMI